MEANILDESCEYPNFGYDCYGECLTDSDNDGICDELEVVGCQDDSFYNYNSEATDSGCPTGSQGWLSSAATDYDSDGCQDSTIEDLDDDNDGVLDVSDNSGRFRLDFNGNNRL